MSYFLSLFKSNIGFHVPKKKKPQAKSEKTKEVDSVRH